MVSALFLALALPVTATTYECFSQPHVNLGTCTPTSDDDNGEGGGWANVDMDSIGDTDAYGYTTDQDISIEFKKKECCTVDDDGDVVCTGSEVPCELADRTKHGPTVGGFAYEQINGRYVLDCAQIATTPGRPVTQTGGEKTIMIKVTRPSEITEFGGEWVKAYEKDSWENVTNEYEPFTFNDFGSKIPLQEFRATTKDGHGRTIVDDAAPVDAIHVFMVMDKVGDYEVRYGNPNLNVTGGTADQWIAIEFKKHQLRVGSPWATCGDTGIAAASYADVGTLVPVYLGNPSLNLHAYQAVGKTISDAFAETSAIPTKVILPMFAPDNDGADKDPEPAATTVAGATLTWTEGWVACTADDCGADTCDADAIAECKASNMRWGYSPNTAYHCDSRWTDKDGTGVGSVTDDDIADGICVKKEYTSCYKSGAACPLDHSTCSPKNCELQRWREIVDMFNDIDSVDVLALVETKDADGATRSKEAIEKDIALYKAHVPAIKGFYFNQVGTDIDGPPEQTTTTQVAALIDIAQDELKCAADTSTTPPTPACGDYFVAFGVGEPLFDTDAVVEYGTQMKDGAYVPAVDLWVTLNDDAGSLGVWTPYSWFSSLANGYTFAAKNWGALVTDVTDAADYTPTTTTLPGTASIITTLFDRGYGYVYLTDQEFFNTTNGKLKDLISGINGMGRRRLTEEEEEAPKKRFLQDVVDNGVTRTQFQCDDTLFECKPVCVEGNGAVFNKVPDSKCAGPKPDECSCRCFYDAYWTCEDDKIVCKAKIQGGDEQTVGDLVCSTRGTPKPAWDVAGTAVLERAAAGVCQPLAVLREARPAAQCLVQYAAEKKLRQEAAAAAAAAADAMDTVQMADLDLNLLDAGAPVSMILGAVLALYF